MESTECEFSAQIILARKRSLSKDLTNFGVAMLLNFISDFFFIFIADCQYINNA